MNMKSDFLHNFLFIFFPLKCIEQMQRETDYFVHDRLHWELYHIQTRCGFLSVSRFVDDSRNRAGVNTLENV